MVTIDNPIPVLILQHPSESKHPYNTGRIVKQCLTHCTLIQSEIISDETRKYIEQNQAILLFPNLNWLPAVEPVSQPGDLLVVIDGTWKKAKKMLHLNPWLQSLPRIALTDLPASKYSIRKGTVSDGLSTIESVTLAMNTLDSNQDYSGLLQPFEMMITLAQRYHPKD